MAESIVQVTSAGTTKLHTWQRTIGANNVEDEFVIPGEYPLASYTVVPTGSVSVATANDHILQIMAGASLNVRIRRIRFEQSGNATTAAIGILEIWRLSSAGTGGTAVTPAKLDTGDAASGATAMTLPTVKGTESVLVMRSALIYRQAVSATAAGVDDAWEWVQQPGQKPLIIPAGAANGIAIKSGSAIAAGTVIPYVEFVETSFL